MRYNYWNKKDILWVCRMDCSDGFTVFEIQQAQQVNLNFSYWLYNIMFERTFWYNT